MGLDYIPHQGRSFLGVTKSFVTSGARSNKQTNKQTNKQDYFLKANHIQIRTLELPWQNTNLFPKFYSPF